MGLAYANARYWTGVAPLVRAQLRRWEQRAHAIPDAEERALALEKLAKEGFNARAGAILATLAPRARRERVVEAIVASQLLFDYLDGLTERPSHDPLADGERLFSAFTAALDLSLPPSPSLSAAASSVSSPSSVPSATAEGGYLWELSHAARAALAGLPAAAAVGDLAREIAELTGQAQTHMHAAAQLGTPQLEAWAQGQAARTGLGWREALAGRASSVLVVHALVVAAADPATTRALAEQLAEAYLRVCVLLTLMDSLVDLDEDEDSGTRGFVSLYRGRDELRRTLTATARRASERTRALPDGGHHETMLVGVAAFYSTLPGARSAFAKPVVEAVHEQLRPGIAPALAVMRAWRLAKRVR